jgi:uncharacterized membrane protein YqjE
MAEVNDKMDSTNARQDDRRDLPSLIERLAGEVSTLFDQKLMLLRVEVREEVDAYVRGSIFILAGGIVAAIGFALANIALAFLVSTLFATANISQPAKYALGFVITGIAYLVIGGALIAITKNRLAKQGIIPRRTMQELERDKEWLQEVTDEQISGGR